MRLIRFLTLLPPLAALALAGTGCGEVKIEKREEAAPDPKQSFSAALEKHLEDTRLLTESGINRRASFSSDGRSIVWLRQADAAGEFRIYSMKADGGDPHLVPTGVGRCYDPAFSPDGKAILYAAAASGGDPVPAAAAGPGLRLFNPALDLFRCGLDGQAPQRLTDRPGFDGEGSYSWGGAKIVFTSFRDGSGDLWLMNADGTGQERLVRLAAYAGGARVSPDGSQVVFHAAGADGRTVEIYLADLPGCVPRRLTSLGATSFAPVWHPSQKFIVFTSNAAEHDYELFAVRPDGSGLERVTYSLGFDGFAEFSRAGDRIVWTTQRGSSEGGHTNIATAHWAR